MPWYPGNDGHKCYPCAQRPHSFRAMLVAHPSLYAQQELHASHQCCSAPEPAGESKACRRFADTFQCSDGARIALGRAGSWAHL